MSLNYAAFTERDRIIAGLSAREVLDYVNIGGYVSESRVARAEREVRRQLDARERAKERTGMFAETRKAGAA